MEQEVQKRVDKTKNFVDKMGERYWNTSIFNQDLITH